MVRLVVMMIGALLIPLSCAVLTNALLPAPINAGIFPLLPAAPPAQLGIALAAMFAGLFCIMVGPKKVANR